ncbi:unnamed protein product [Paramecium pentaurelia]|uniref:Myb-like domain-containing protein n=1 Tax=Paramecium pentaurelia TaxID=43138 RepID=A0A8S1U7W0_9CILI|nr:unnamed protein product [Paramecium pentaurelia]
MPKHVQVYTERFDQVLEMLVSKVGEAKWAEITRQMKNLYGINVPQKPMVQARWRAIDPKINREPFTQEEMVQHWHHCVRFKCHWDAIRDQYELIGQQRDKTYLSQRFSIYFTQKLSELNREIGKIASYNQQKIDTMRETTKKRVIEFNSRDPLSVQDQSAREIIVSCKSLVKVMTYLVDNSHLQTELMWAEVKKIISPAKFQKVLFNIFIMDTIVLISCNELKAIDDTSDLIDADDFRKGKYIKPTKIKFWKDALEHESSPEHTEEDEILTTSVRLSRMGPQTQFTKKDIEEIKESFIYKYCNTDQNKAFYNWYNEAKTQKNAFPSDLTVDVMELEGGKQLLNYDPTQPKRKYVRKQKAETKVQKQIEKFKRKKQKIQIEGEGKQRIKTKKGRIRLHKERFPGQDTIQFNQQLEEEEDVSSDDYQLMDAEQIYKINMRMNRQNDISQSENDSQSSD